MLVKLDEDTEVKQNHPLPTTNYVCHFYRWNILKANVIYAKCAKAGRL